MRTFLLIALLIPVPMQAQTARDTNPLAADVERLSAELNPQVVAWRRDFHQHPELGNRETRTAKIIAGAHLSESLKTSRSSNRRSRASSCSSA